MKRLSLDDFKKKADSLDTKKALSSIKGGVAQDYCHGSSSTNDKICSAIVAAIIQSQH